MQTPKWEQGGPPVGIFLRPHTNIVVIPQFTTEVGSHDNVIPHEIGHGFDLEHVSKAFNLMCGDYLLCTNTFSTGLETWQVNDARRRATELQEDIP